jgi:transcriptional regulator with XRE-family HTH domain
MKLLRDNRGFSLRQLGEATGIRFQDLGLMERGIQTPTNEQLEQICVALGVSADMIYPDPRIMEVLAE